MDIMQDATTVEKALMSQAAYNRIPINGSIELLPLCNMNCDMCYVRLSREEMESQGRLRTADEWIEIGKQMQKAGVLFLLLTGGEPLLYPEFKRLYLEFLKMGFIITINTNGTLIDEEWAKFFAEYKPRRINITLYGADENAYTNLCHYPGGFQKTIQGIQLLKENKVDVKVGGSLTKANQNDIERIIELSHELNVPVQIDTYMLPATRERTQPYNIQSRVEPEKAAQIHMMALRKDRGNDFFLQYIEQTLKMIETFQPPAEKQGLTCMAGKCSFTINWQGEMRPCVILSSPTVSVFDNSFETAWEILKEDTDKIFVSNKCSKCKLRPVCKTCAASALFEAGNYEAVPDYMCRYAEESYGILQNLKYSKNNL